MVIWYFVKSIQKPFLKFKNDFFAENEEKIFTKLYAPTSKRQDSKEEAEEAVQTDQSYQVKSGSR